MVYKVSESKGFNKQNERVISDIISKRRTFAAVNEQSVTE